MTAVPDAIFEPVAPDRYRPTDLAIGPWDRNALHGGPPAALVAGALEQAIVAADLGADFVPARLTVELLRPVPVDELTVTTTMRRPGRRICLADATITTADGTVVLAATLEGIRVRPFDHGVGADLHVPPGPATGAGLAAETLDGPQAFHNAGVEHRLVRGTRFESPGPATDWIRLTFPLVAGRETTPLERVVVAADFGNGVSRLFGMDDVLFLNPDLTVHLYRLPVGEWVCLDAVTRLGDAGVGLAESILFDEEGPIGRATQLLLVEPR
jgi:acyl-coenzyme A thioesterase PaaI-like protein